MPLLLKEILNIHQVHIPFPNFDSFKEMFKTIGAKMSMNSEGHSNKIPFPEKVDIFNIALNSGLQAP